MLLTPEEHADINRAIREAEKSTFGEIYCVAAEEASSYREVPLAIGAMAALVLPALLLLIGVNPASLAGWRAAHLAAAESDMASSAALLIAAQALLFAAATLIASIPAVRRIFTPAALKRERVRRRALEQFLAKNLHRTQGRTGVLIFVSLAERMAELIADEGIAARVEPKIWEQPMEVLVQAMRNHEPKRGLVAAIEQCGAILAKHVPADGRNPNELPDTVAELPRP